MDEFSSPSVPAPKPEEQETGTKLLEKYLPQRYGNGDRQRKKQIEVLERKLQISVEEEAHRKKLQDILTMEAELAKAAEEKRAAERHQRGLERIYDINEQIEAEREEDEIHTQQKFAAMRINQEWEKVHEGLKERHDRKVAADKRAYYLAQEFHEPEPMRVKREAREKWQKSVTSKYYSKEDRFVRWRKKAAQERAEAAARRAVVRDQRMERALEFKYKKELQRQKTYQKKWELISEKSEKVLSNKEQARHDRFQSISQTVISNSYDARARRRELEGELDAMKRMKAGAASIKRNNTMSTVMATKAQALEKKREEASMRHALVAYRRETSEQLRQVDLDIGVQAQQQRQKTVDSVKAEYEAHRQRMQKSMVEHVRVKNAINDVKWRVNNVPNLKKTVRDKRTLEAVLTPRLTEVRKKKNSRPPTTDEIEARSKPLSMNRKLKCSVCLQTFLVSNLPHEVAFQTILRKKQEWGMPVANISKFTKPAWVYNKAPLCVFCYQFFDEDVEEPGCTPRTQEEIDGMSSEQAEEVREGFRKVNAIRILKTPDLPAADGAPPHPPKRAQSAGPLVRTRTIIGEDGGTRQTQVVTKQSSSRRVIFGKERPKPQYTPADQPMASIPFSSPHTPPVIPYPPPPRASSSLR